MKAEIRRTLVAARPIDHLIVTGAPLLVVTTIEDHALHLVVTARLHKTMSTSQEVEGAMIVPEVARLAAALGVHHSEEEIMGQDIVDGLDHHLEAMVAHGHHYHNEDARDHLTTLHLDQGLRYHKREVETTHHLPHTDNAHHLQRNMGGTVSGKEMGMIDVDTHLQEKHRLDIHQGRTITAQENVPAPHLVFPLMPLVVHRRYHLAVPHRPCILTEWPSTHALLGMAPHVTNHR